MIKEMTVAQSSHNCLLSEASTSPWSIGQPLLG